MVLIKYQKYLTNCTLYLSIYNRFTSSWKVFKNFLEHIFNFAIVIVIGNTACGNVVIGITIFGEIHIIKNTIAIYAKNIIICRICKPLCLFFAPSRRISKIYHDIHIEIFSGFSNIIIYFIKLVLCENFLFVDNPRT